MVGRRLIDTTDTVWEVVQDEMGPYGNLYLLRMEGKPEGKTYEILVSGYEILHGFTPYHEQKEN